MMVDHRFVDVYGARADLKRAEEALSSASQKLNEYETWCESPLTGAWADMIGGLSQTVGAILQEIEETDIDDGTVRTQVP